MIRLFGQNLNVFKAFHCNHNCQQYIYTNPMQKNDEPRLNFRQTRSRFYHKKSSHQENGGSVPAQQNTGLYWKQKGNQEFKNNNIAQAIQHYSKAILMSPGESVFYSNRAKCYKMLGDFKSALKDAEQACQLDDSNVKAHYTCGCILAELSKQDFSKIKKAENRLKKALRLCYSQKKQTFIEDISIKIYRLRKLEWYLQKEKELLILKHQRKAVNFAFENKQLSKQTYNDILGSLSKRQKQVCDMPSIPDHLFCKITLQLMQEPVCTQAGFSYERSAIQDHFKTTNQFIQPISRKPISGKLYPNLALKKQVELFLEQNPWAFQHSNDEDYLKIEFQ